MRSRHAVNQRKPRADDRPMPAEAPHAALPRVSPARTITGTDHECDRTVSSGTVCLESIRARFVELHGRLLAGDVAVAEDLCALLLPELRRQIRPRDPRIPLEAVEDAIDDTLATLVWAPGRCDPARGDPIAWLVTIARNKVKDIERAAWRRWRREVPLTDEVTARLLSQARSDLDELADRRAWIENRRRQVLELVKTEPEVRFVLARLRLAPVAEQAEALGAVDLPQAEQRALVNRVWQRLHRRFVRSAIA